MTIANFKNNKSNNETEIKGGMKDAVRYAKYIVTENDIAEAQNRIRELKAYVKVAMDAGLKTVIVKLPRYFFRIDPEYQIPVRTERDLRYLLNNFDNNKLLPLQGVIHWELGLVFLFDGYGRLVVTEDLNTNGEYDYLEVMIPLNVTQDPAERQKYEAEMYATQNITVAKMTPLQKHGALRIMGDTTVLTMDRLQKKYGFKYSTTRGQRDEGVIGSYMEFYRSIKGNGYTYGDYLFSLCKNARMDQKVNGYSVYIMRAIRDIYKLYPQYRAESFEFLSVYMRERPVSVIKADGVSKYPMVDQILATSMHLEDEVAKYIGIDMVRIIDEDGKVITKQEIS